MIDSDLLGNLIEQQIKQHVQQQVSKLLEGRDLVSEIQQDLIEHTKDRITARFANINDMPGLITVIQNSVRKLIEDGLLPGLENYVDTAELQQQINSKLGTLIDRTIDNLILDSDWVEQVEAQVNRMFAHKFSERLSLVDFDSMIGRHIDAGIEKWHDKLIENFATHGIRDEAKQTEVTVFDGGVNVENTLVSNSAVIGGDAEINGTLSVNNLSLRGSVNVDNRSWAELIDHISDRANQNLTQQWADNLKQQVMSLISQKGIEFQSVQIDGKPLLDGGILNHSIKDTAIERLGTLINLTVSGPAALSDTLNVNKKRVGINTDTPDMALSVWDEEVALSIGKSAKNLAYVGTSRLQNLAIGVNRGRQIEIDVSGLVTISQLKVGHFRISHEPKVPGYSGARGDIVFNSDPRTGDPFAWQCLGSYQWRPLKAIE